MKFYLQEAIDCGILKTFNHEYAGTTQILIPFRNDLALSVVSTNKDVEHTTGLYDQLGYEVWDYDKGILPNGGPVSMSEDMINDLVNNYLVEMKKDFSFIIPASEIKEITEEEVDEEEDEKWAEMSDEEFNRLMDSP